MSDSVQRFPEWKNAIEEILNEIEANGHGATITHAKLDEWFGLVEPVDVKAYKKYVFKRLSCLDALKFHLLEDHSVCLDSVRGVGYKILQPGEQVDRVPEVYMDRAKNGVRRAMSSLVHVKATELTPAELSIRSRKIERLGFISVSMRGRLTDRLSGAQRSVVGG